MKKPVVILFVLTAMCASASSGADAVATASAGDGTLTLEQALALAERHHPQLAEVQATEAHAALTSALAGSKAYQGEILPRAELALQTAETRYAAGDISLVEVLPARREWATLQLAYLESLREVMQAWAGLAPYLPRS